ncbi:MAG TPA: hypothetical protein VL475_02395 [Planctomycetaceae bacterium]|nr:hypothetical protein [Planctomycetaceae bacterium]
MSTIDIAMTAWPRTAARLSYMRRTLESIQEHVRNSRGELRLRVSLESADVPTALERETEALLRGFRLEQWGPVVSGENPVLSTEVIWAWRSKPPSLGGNMNDALRMCSGADFILLTQDDWTWNHPTELSLDADQLGCALGYAMIRYATFYCEFTHALNERLWNVDVNTKYAYGDQPHLRRGSFVEEFGWYVESQTGDYATPEQAMADRLRENNWGIAAYHPNRVDHCGSLSSSEERQREPLRQHG